VNIGFTGTQRGLTGNQKHALWFFLKSTEPSVVLHHGDCIGADANADRIAKSLSVKTILHPPTDKRKRAFCEADLERHPLPYLERNKAIVSFSDIIVACPKGLKEEIRSGTWATIRYARKVGKPVVIIEP
jgi:hypothetical protein